MRPPLVSLSLLAVLVLSACGKAPEDPRTLAPVVDYAKALPAPATSRAFTGVVASRVQSALGFRVAGKVAVRLVEAGQRVRAGQVLMRLDAADYAHAVAAAAGQAAAAAARDRQAGADFARFDGLVQSGAVSQSAYDQARAAAQAAHAEAAAALAQLHAAEDNRRYTALRADADGTVMDTEAEPGQVVAAGQGVLRLAHDGPREAVIALPEGLRPALGSPALARIYDGAAAPARLRQLSDTADPATRTYEARYVLSGRAAAAPLGATVTLLLPRPPDGGLLVPLTALDDEGRGSGVWLIAADQTVSFHPVQVRRLDSDSAEIDGADLADGQTLVAAGGHFLRPGEKIRLGREISLR